MTKALRPFQGVLELGGRVESIVHDGSQNSLGP